MSAKIDDLWARAEAQVTPAKSRRAPYVVNEKRKRILIDRVIQFTIVDVAYKSRGDRNWWHVTIEIDELDFKAQGEGLPGTRMRLEFIDDTKRSQVYGEIATSLPYGKCILVEDGRYLKVVSAPPRTKKGDRGA